MRRRRRLLARAGPVLLPLTVIVWVVQVVVGFALIYLPFTKDLATPPGRGKADWVSALYVSAYSRTTLGVGDLHATTGPLPLLVTLEAALGFALFTVSITYLLSVYSTPQRTTSLALAITTFVGRQSGDDGVDAARRSFVTNAARKLGEGPSRGDYEDLTGRQYDDARARLSAAGIAPRTEPHARQQFLEMYETWRPHEQRLLRHFRVPGRITAAARHHGSSRSCPWATLRQ